jgi:hypothetical protein
VPFATPDSMINPPPKKPTIPTPPELEFELTQEIDPLFADLVGGASEPTLTQLDFDDLEAALDVAAPRRAARRN